MNALFAALSGMELLALIAALYAFLAAALWTLLGVLVYRHWTEIALFAGLLWAWFAEVEEGRRT